MIAADLVTSVHDVADGGLLVALAEVALASGCGIEIELLGDVTNTASGWFGEDQGRYVITANPDQPGGLLEEYLREQRVPFVYLGSIRRHPHIWLQRMDGTTDEVWSVPLADLRAAHEGFFPKLMGADAALA
jgi:phosphoribosylformylglycinamidine synthase